MIEFKCGCQFEENNKGLPIFAPYFDKIRLTCPDTWELISSGNTKGVFQLDSQLGQSLSSKAQPHDMNELADLTAILRPGCMDSLVEGKTLTNHYIDRKHGRDEVKYFHPALEPILRATYGILVYQEEALHIAKDIAGYNLSEAEILRKAIGKKKVELMAKVKAQFLDKIEAHQIVTREEGQEIFSWIEASQRYAFNYIHAVSYAHNGYLTAFAKTHFPPAFFTAWLRHAKGKIKPADEIEELVNNARLMDIDIMPPSILYMNKSFKIFDGSPRYGLMNVKGVGESAYLQLKNKIRKEKYDLTQFSWDQFLMKLGRHVRKDSLEGFIKAGALDCFNVSRTKMMYDFALYRDFRKHDHKFLEEGNFPTLENGLESILKDKIPNERRTAHTNKFIDLFKGALVALNKPPYDLIDLPSWKAKQEREYLSVELTCTEIDEYDTTQANCTCREFIKGFQSPSIAIAVKVNDVREWTIKRGKNKGGKMAFLKVSDGTCSLDNATVFSQTWDKCKNVLAKDSILLLRGNRDENQGSFLVKSAQKLTQAI